MSNSEENDRLCGCGDRTTSNRASFCKQCRDVRRKNANRIAQEKVRANRRHKKAAAKPGYIPPLTLTASQVVEVKAALHDLFQVVARTTQRKNENYDPNVLVDYMLSRVYGAHQKLSDLLSPDP